MEPIFGFALYFVAVVVVAGIARKRGRSALLYGLVTLVLGPCLVILIAQGGGSGTAAGFGAFLIPIGALVMLMLSDTGQQAAVRTGAHGEFKKCPFCAESVRFEAIKCKHCGSSLDEKTTT